MVPLVRRLVGVDPDVCTSCGRRLVSYEGHRVHVGWGTTLCPERAVPDRTGRLR